MDIKDALTRANATGFIGKIVPGEARPSLGRTNAQWIDALQRAESPSTKAAVEDLRAYLRSGLGRTFAAERSVQESDLEDFTQDAVLKILRALDSFRGNSRFYHMGNENCDSRCIHRAAAAPVRSHLPRRHPSRDR